VLICNGIHFNSVQAPLLTVVIKQKDILLPEGSFEPSRIELTPIPVMSSSFPKHVTTYNTHTNVLSPRTDSALTLKTLNSAKDPQATPVC
jgi:hypothetical protein